MGYDLHITRREHWTDDEDDNKISITEWLTYVESDDELELTNGFQTKIPGVENTFHNVPGFSNWSGHTNMKGDSQPWFDYRDGYISTKNPDDETIKKMITIAETLNAKVQGDDGELYDDTYFLDKQLTSLQEENTFKKPWWKLW